MNLCGETTSEILTGHQGFCGPQTIINNPQYFIFTANSTEVEIHILVEFPCSGGNSALQSAIIEIVEPCDQWDNLNVLACHPGIIPGGLMMLFFNAEVGKEYYLLIDGSNGATCSYLIQFADGVECIEIEGDITGISGDQDLCHGGENYHFEVSDTISSFTNYLWSPSWSLEDPITTLEPEIYLDIPDEIPPGTYNLCAQATNGCHTSEAQICMEVAIRPAPTIGLPSDTLWCMLEPLMLQADTGYAEYAWSTGDTTSAIEVQNPGAHRITVTTDQGCKKSATVNVNQMEPLPAILGTEEICPDGEGNLTVDTTALYYEWNTTDTTQSVVISGPGEFCVTITYEDCRQVVCKQVELIQVEATVVDSGETNLCTDGEHRLSIEFAGRPPFIISSIIDGQDTTLFVEQDSSLSIPYSMEGGHLQVYFHGDADCNFYQLLWEDTIPGLLQVDSIGIGEFDSLDMVEVNFFASGGTPPYNYSFSTGLVNQSGMFQVGEPGDYCVTIYDQLGCKIDTCVTVGDPSVVLNPQIEHIAISPNPAKHKIQLTGRGSSAYEATIIDQTGKTMLHTMVEQSGRIDLGPLANGMYFCLVKELKTQRVRVFKVIKID